MPVLLPIDERPMREPLYLRPLMNMYRLDMMTIPLDYIEYHQGIAEDELRRLRAEYGFRVLEQKMEKDGWCDGMLVLNAIIVTKSGHPKRLVYNDSNRGFMMQMPSGGSALPSDHDML